MPYLPRRMAPMLQPHPGPSMCWGPCKVCGIAASVFPADAELGARPGASPKETQGGTATTLEVRVEPSPPTVLLSRPPFMNTVSQVRIPTEEGRNALCGRGGGCTVFCVCDFDKCTKIRLELPLLSQHVASRRTPAPAAPPRVTSFGWKSTGDRGSWSAWLMGQMPFQKPRPPAGSRVRVAASKKVRCVGARSLGSGPSPSSASVPCPGPQQERPVWPVLLHSPCHTPLQVQPRGGDPG